MDYVCVFSMERTCFTSFDLVGLVQRVMMVMGFVASCLLSISA